MESFNFQAFIGLGSNLGDRSIYLQQALAEIETHSLVKLTKVSSVYESEPVGYLDQGWFLNQVAEVATGLEPEDLLNVLQEIENRLGRKRLIRWGPRVIDLDLLLYEKRIINSPRLIVPHPRIYERGFVLWPLCEIAPDFVHPDGKKTCEHFEAYLKKGSERVFLYHKTKL